MLKTQVFEPIMKEIRYWKNVNPKSPLDVDNKK